MDLNKEKYIILELIPTSINNGQVIELSALKLDGIKLLDRLNLRLRDDLIPNDSFRDIISYDKDSFVYLDSTYDIIEKFKDFSDDLPILILDDIYTKNYISKLDNKKESILNYLDLDYSDDVINRIIKKYKLEESNYIVDLLYEALIREI